MIPGLLWSVSDFVLAWNWFSWSVTILAYPDFLWINYEAYDIPDAFRHYLLCDIRRP